MSRVGARGTAVYLLAIAVAALVFYREFVFHPDRMLFGTDMLDQAYQLRKFAVDELKAGRGLPLWNPFVYGGLPFLAVLPGPVFYPTSLLYLVLPLYRAIGWTFVLHTFLAGAFGYYAGRAFQLDRWAAAVTGVAFMFSGYLMSTLLYGGHDGRMFAMALIPLAFALLERGLRSGRAEWFLGLGLVVALQIFTPHVQVMYFSSLALCAYALFGLIRLGRERGDIKAAAPVAAWFVLAFVIAALIGAAQLWPTATLLEFAVRGIPGQEGYEFASSWALPAQELSAFLLPDVVGSLGEYWGTNQFKLHTEHLGAVPLALAVIAVVTGKRDPRIWFFAAAGVVGVLFALGAATPVHRVAFTVVPLISSFRAPSMMLAPVAFAVALLAGFGWQAVADAARSSDRGVAEEGEDRGAHAGAAMSRTVRLPWGWILALSAPFLLFGLAAALAPAGVHAWALNGWYPAGWHLQASATLASSLRVSGWLVLVSWGAVLFVAWAMERRRVPETVCAALLALSAVEAWRVDARFLQTVRPAEVFADDAAIDRIRSGLAPGQRVWPLQGTYRPNELMYYGLPAVTGSQNFRLEWYDRLVGGLSYANLGQSPALWALFDLRYLTAPASLNAPFLTEAGQGPRGLVYLMPETPGHAFFPRQVEVIADSAAALQRVLGLADPQELAVVAGTESSGAGELTAGAGRASIVAYSPNVITLDVVAERPGLLVVSEIYHPNWRATLEGRELPVYRTNVAFRGIQVPEGQHEIVFRYAAGEVRVAGLLSAGVALITVIAIVSLILRARRRDT